MEALDILLNLIHELPDTKVVTIGDLKKLINKTKVELEANEFDPGDYMPPPML